MPTPSRILIYFDELVPFEREALEGLEQALRGTSDRMIWGIFGPKAFERMLTSGRSYDVLIAFTQQNPLPTLPTAFAARTVLAYNCVPEPELAERPFRVRLDDALCGHLAARHLHQAGYSILAVAAAPSAPEMSARRLSGFIDYCNDHGLPYQQLRMQGTSEVEGMLQLRAWAGSLGEDRVGVFTAIDHTGNILTKIAQEEGIPVPERLGIIGCGDMTKLHVFAQIPLTSVGIPWVELGFQAGILAREALAGLPARDVLISPSGIITRKSTDAHATTDTFGRRVWLDLQTHLKDIPTVSELARRNHVGERQFTRRIWECFGCSPANLISKARVERARQMLVSSHATIDVIAEACGLSSARALQKIFLRETGLPPTAFRAQVRSAEPQPADPLQGVTAAVFPKRTP